MRALILLQSEGSDQWRVDTMDTDGITVPNIKSDVESLATKISQDGTDRENYVKFKTIGADGVTYLHTVKNNTKSLKIQNLL